MDRKKKLYFEHSSSSSHSATSSSSSASFSSSSSSPSPSSSSTFSSSSSSSSSSRTQQGSRQEHPDSRLTTLTEEERRRYEEEKKLGFETEEELSRTSGGRGTGHFEHHYTSESGYGVGSHQSRGGGKAGGVRVENETGRTDNYRGRSSFGRDGDGRGSVEDQRGGNGVEISAGGAQVGTAGHSRTHSSRNFSATWSEDSEAPRRYSNYSYSNWTSGGDESGVGVSAYGRGSHDVTSSHHSSPSSAESRHGYARQGGSSAHLDSAGSTGSARHYSTSWSSGGTEGSDNVGRGYQGAGHGAGGAHITFSTETSDISDNIGARYQSSHLSNAGRIGSAQGIDNRTRFQEHQTWSTQDNAHVSTNRFNSDLEESARGSGGFRHYVWSPQVSGDSVSGHETSSSGLERTRGHIGRDSHVGIETDSAGAGQQWYSGSGSAQYGVAGGEEAARRQHGGSYSWSTVDSGATQGHGFNNNNNDYDAWRGGYDAHGTHRDNVDDSVDRRGGRTHDTGGSVEVTQQHSSSNLGYGGGGGGGGSRQYSSHHESGTSWSVSDRTVSGNKLEGSDDDQPSGQLKLYRKYRHHSSVEDNSGERQSKRRRRNVDDAELERATHCNITKCSKMRCVLGPMAKGEEVKFAFRFLVWAKTLKSVSFILSFLVIYGFIKNMSIAQII